MPFPRQARDRGWMVVHQCYSQPHCGDHGRVSTPREAPSDRERPDTRRSPADSECIGGDHGSSEGDWPYCKAVPYHPGQAARGSWRAGAIDYALVSCLIITFILDVEGKQVDERTITDEYSK